MFVVAPVISVIGETALYIAQYDDYSDAGATASDDEDGDLTANITTSGLPVDTTKPGYYLVTYDVTDAAGNAAFQQSRLVMVVVQTREMIVMMLL